MVGVSNAIVKNSRDLSNRSHIPVNSYSKLFLKSSMQRNLHIGDFSWKHLLQNICDLVICNISAMSWYLNIVGCFYSFFFFFKENSS